MELRDFAERVLFATDLEEKLGPPDGELTDERPGSAMTTPAAPGRPENLRLGLPSRSGARDRDASLPLGPRLEDESERGTLLHFFANHELLATELMALALLRFPDAPPAFRQGLALTLREEQMHTRLYLARMRECGVAFGDIPVNGFFWRMVSPMESTLDYVSRLSLTFEQANLDYSRHFAAVFRASGDDATARVLDRIHRDEIAHVGYGLRWFRRWKESGISDWDAFGKRLPYPLTPARAKGGGVAFNREGRLRAGMAPDFIERLEVCSASRGRTPDVFLFNADAESRLAGDAVPETVERLMRDLAMLAVPLARADDVLVVPELPDIAFLQSLVRHGIQPPELIERSRLHELGTRKLRALRPWAWTEEAERELASLIPALTTAPPRTVPRELFSKETSAAWQRDLALSAGSEWETFLAPASVAGILVQDLDTIAECLAGTDPRDGWRGLPLVVKAPFSTAGRERVILDAVPGPEAWKAAGRLLERHGTLVAEPWLDRVFDFSIQYERPAGGPIRRLGMTALRNSRGGAFRSCTRPHRFSKLLPADVVRLVHQPDAPRRGLLEQALREVVEPLLEHRLAEFDFVGPLGVDAFLYREAGGGIRLKPIVEINPRFTMGRVTLELARRAAPHRSTTLEILTLSQIRRLGFADFPAFADSLPAPPPGGSQGPSSGKLGPGRIVLNDPRTARAFLAVVSIA